MSLDADLRLGTKPAAAVTDEVVPGLVWGVRCRGQSAVRVTEELAPPAAGEWLWLHVNLADTRTEGWLAGCGLLPKAGIERLVSKDDVQQLVPLGDAVAGVFFDLVHDFDRASEEFGLVRFVLTDRVLVTGRRRAMSSVEAVRRRIEAGHRYGSPVDLGGRHRRPDRPGHRRDGRRTRHGDRTRSRTRSSRRATATTGCGSAMRG